MHNRYWGLGRNGTVNVFKGGSFALVKANNHIAAPGLTLGNWDEGKREIKVAEDSPLRGAGIPFPEVKTDFFGKPRDAQKPDIGPFALNGW